MQIAPTNKKRRFWSIAALLVLALTLLEVCFSIGLTDLPVLRGVKVQWYVMRLNHEDPEIQVTAARSLEAMGPKAKSAVSTLAESFETSNSARVRFATLSALAAIGPEAKSVVPMLIRDTADRGFIVPDFDTLRKIGEPSHEPLIALLQDKDLRVRRSAGLGLACMLREIENPEIRAKAIEPLIAALKVTDKAAGPNKEDSDALVRDFRISFRNALCQIGEPALGHLIVALRDNDADVCCCIAEAIGIILAFEDPLDPEIRTKAVEALVLAIAEGRINAIDANTALRASEISDTALEPLLTALQDDDASVRYHAEQAIEWLMRNKCTVKAPETFGKVVQQLIALQYDEDNGPVPVNMAIEALRQAIDVAKVDAPEILAPAAESLIRVMSNREYMFAGHVNQLVRIGAPAVDPLIIALQDEDVQVRRIGVVGLSYILRYDYKKNAPDADVYARTISALTDASNNDTDPQVRTRATGALNHISKD